MNLDILDKSKLTLLVIFGSLIASCEDFVEIDPPRTEVIRETIFSSDQTANIAMNGIYVEMRGFGLFTYHSVVPTGLLSDELTYLASSVRNIDYEANDVKANNSELFSSFWQLPYKLINNANGIIEGLTSNTQVSPDLRDHLIGEALFIRAFVHFYLTNLFGEVPYVTTTDIEANNAASRMPVDLIYDQLTVDLLEAQSLMYDDYEFLDNQRIRATRFAATSLLARVYLYSENWEGADQQSTAILERPDLFKLEENLNEVFLATNEESILQLVTQNSFEREGTTFLGDYLVINRPPGPNSFVGAFPVNDNLVSIFDSSDNRLVDWIGTFVSGAASYNFSNKYKNANLFQNGPAEHTILLRLAEQYLIRAEARAKLNNLSGSLADINAIRNRAGLPDTTFNDQASALGVIELERRKELFVEGHRWFDLKRTGNADAVLGSVKAGWQSTDVLLPIPEVEILNNSNLAPQNLGY